MSRASASLLVALLLAGCGGGGGGGTTTPPIVLPTALPTALPTSQPSSAPTAAPTAMPSGLVQTYFAFGAPSGAVAANSSRRPQFLPKGMNSATISLTSSDSISLSAPITVNVALVNCPCVVAGPLAPPGNDTFVVSVYDGVIKNGAVSGAKLAEGSAKASIAAGVDNNVSITLKGIAASLSIGSLTQGKANTASSQSVSLSVLDADGNAISGDYSNPVSVSVNDGVGDLTYGLALVLGACPGGSTCGATSITSSNSNDVITLKYRGLAIKSSTLSASSTDANGNAISTSATFTPVLQDMVFTLGANTPSTKSQEIDLFATTGLGSSGSFSVSELGYSNYPYSKSFTAAPSTPNACSQIATVSASGGGFAVQAVAAPSSGSCTIVVSDGVHASPLNVTVTYTKVKFGVQ